MVPICESLTRSAAAVCSCKAFEFDMNPDVTHSVYIFHHILACTGAHGERGSASVGVAQVN